MVYVTAENDEERLLASHVADMCEASERRSCVKYSTFMNERQATVAMSVLSHLHCDSYRFYGGYENAERKMLCVYPSYSETEDGDFPISAIEFSFRKADRLSHRDFLGSLMALMIKRELVGDILVEEGRAVVFVCDRIAPMILQEVTKIGRTGVRASATDETQVTAKPDFEDIKAVVASLRLDAVVSAVTKLSREKSAELIRSIGAEVNFKRVLSPSGQLDTGDVFSVRGYGKFILSEAGEPTKKGRLHITVKKYI